MAEIGSIISKQQRLASTKVQENHQDSSKFYNQFLYKALFVSLFLLVVPLFPLQGPAFVNQRLHTTSYEILQLIFVGIAVSYGLFSKRNDITDKDLHSSKFDNAQSYISGLLQVSSVFDDETETLSSSYENNVQIWTSRYRRGEPMVVVAPKNPGLDQEQSGTHSRVVEKMLSLPVRSLKSRVSDPGVIEPISESNVKSISVGRSSSNLSSKRISRTSSKSKTGEVGGSLAQSPKLEDKVEENIVLRSPIPWRSRSGRMEMKEDIENPFYTLPPSMEESKLNKIEKRTISPISFQHSISSTDSPTKKLSPSASLTSEFQSQNGEDFVKKKSFRKSAPTNPPPPPPPPPPFYHKSPSMRSSTSRDTKDEPFPRRDLKRSVTSVPNKLSGSNREDLENGGKTGEGAEWWTRTTSDGDGSVIMSKYVQTQAPNEPIKGAAQGRDNSDGFVNVNVEPAFIKNRGYPDKIFRENPSFRTGSKEEKEKGFVEEVLVASEDEDPGTDENEDDEFENQEVPHNSANDGGPDVDKKADEFIAKFREQIRLQRIASIRKSTGQVQKNTMR